MTAVEDEDDLDLMLDEVTPAPKKKAVPLKRTPKQQAALQLAAEQKATAQRAQMLAQIVNLHIAGLSLADIGAQIGASAEEVDRLINAEAARYVRNQPALRTYVRNFISAKYTGLLDAVWDKAVDKTAEDQLDYFDRAQRVLAQMGRLHGAEAPTQSEVKVEAAPEAVDLLVQAIATSQGMGYDMDIFDTVPGEVVHEAAAQAEERVVVSGNAVEESDGHDEL